MPSFKQKPQSVTAVQWDGKPATAKDIVAVLKAAGQEDHVTLDCNSIGWQQCVTPVGTMVVGDYISALGNKVSIVGKVEFENMYSPE